MRSKKSTIALIAVAAAGAGFFLAPRFMQATVSQSLSQAAVWSASRIPSAKVAAAEEGGDTASIAPARSLEVSGATIALPLHVAATMQNPTAAPATPAATATATATAPATAKATARTTSHHGTTDPPMPDVAMPQASASAATAPDASATADPAASAPAPQPTNTAPAMPPAAPTAFDTRY